MQVFQLGNYTPTFEVYYGDINCFTEDNKNNARDIDGAKDLVILTVLACIGLLIIIGTLVEVFAILKPSDLSASEKKTINMGLQLLMSFSLYSNGASLLSTKTGGSGHLDSMNAMK